MINLELAQIVVVQGILHFKNYVNIIGYWIFHHDKVEMSSLSAANYRHYGEN